MTTLLCYECTIVSLEVLGMDLHVLDSGRDRHHYTLPCLHSLSMRCHSVFGVPFALPWPCILRRTAHSTFSPLAQSLSSPLHFSPICFHLTALSFSTPLLSLSLSSLPLSLSPFPVSLCLPPLCLCLSPVWYRAGMAVQVSCSGRFRWSSWSTPVKSGTNACTLHF